MKDINEYKKLASEAVDGAWICHETTIRNETIPSLANAVLDLCQRVEKLVIENEALKRNNKEISGFNINSAKQVSELSHEQKVQAVVIHKFEQTIQSQQVTIDKLVKALELAEKELFRFNCDAPIYLTGAKEPVYLQVRQFLAEVRGEK